MLFLQKFLCSHQSTQNSTLQFNLLTTSSIASNSTDCVRYKYSLKIFVVCGWFFFKKENKWILWHFQSLRRKLILDIKQIFCSCNYHFCHDWCALTFLLLRMSGVFLPNWVHIFCIKKNFLIKWNSTLMQKVHKKSLSCYHSRKKIPHGKRPKIIFFLFRLRNVYEKFLSFSSFFRELRCWVEAHLLPKKKNYEFSQQHKNLLGSWRSKARRFGLTTRKLFLSRIWPCPWISPPLVYLLMLSITNNRLSSFFFCCWEDEEIYFIFPFSLWWGFFRLSIIINFYFDRQSFIIKQNESKERQQRDKVWLESLVLFFEGQNDDKIQCVRRENFVLWLICYNIYKTFTLLISLSFLIFSHSSFHHIWNLRSAKQSVTFCVLHPWGWNLYFFSNLKIIFFFNIHRTSCGRYQISTSNTSIIVLVYFKRTILKKTRKF